MAKLSLGRRQDSGSAIRESTAMTTVYLLEMNQKFEAYIRQKVEELEVRVAAQQARTSTAKVEEDEAWLAEEMPIEEAPASEAQVPFADFSLAEPEPEVETGVTAEPLPEEVPDYMALLGGAETSDAEEPVAGDEESPLPEKSGGVETEAETDQELPEKNEEAREVEPAEAGKAEAGDLVDEAGFVPTPGLFTIPEPAAAPDENLPAEAETDAAEDEGPWELPLPEGEKDEWA